MHVSGAVAQLLGDGLAPLVVDVGQDDRRPLGHEQPGGLARRSRWRLR